MILYTIYCSHYFFIHIYYSSEQSGSPSRFSFKEHLRFYTNFCSSSISKSPHEITMRKLSSLAARTIPDISHHAEKKINNLHKPEINPRNILGQNPRASSTGKQQFKDSNFSSIPIKTHILASNSKPIDHHYFAKILSRKDWFLLLNHEYKAQRFILNAQVVVSILQNQENPLSPLRFYIWVSNISASFAKNQSIRSALSNVLYRKGPVLLSAEFLLDIRNSGSRVTEDLLCVLIGSWGRLGLAKYCADVFEQVSYLGISPSTRLYNAVIDGLVKSNSLDLAYVKFHQMEVDNCIPDRYTYNILINGVCKAGVLDEALRLMKQMEGLGYSPNVFTYTILIDGYCNAKRVDEAFRLLERMKVRNLMPNDVTYRSLINGVFRSVSPNEAFESLSGWVKRELNLPKVVYDGILYCLCNNSLPKHAAAFLGMAEEKGYIPDSSIANITMTCLIKGLDIDETCRIFDNLVKRNVKVDLNVWLALIESLYNSRREGKGNQYLTWMIQEDLVTSVFAYNMVIDCFCKIKMMDRALETLEEMCERGILPNLVTFNTLIAGCCKVRDVIKARKLLLMLLDRGFKPDLFTFNSIIEVLCQINQNVDAFDCLLEMVEWGISPNAITYNILIRSLCVSGDVAKALKLLKKMQVDGIRPDVYSFNALIQKYCKINEIEKAQRILVSMLTLDLHPDNFTYTAFINALCESGRFYEAKELFSSMEANGCTPDAYTCNAFFDALVKLGKFEEAQAVWLKYKWKGTTLETEPVISGPLPG